MGRRLLTSAIPVAAAFAAFFLVLPKTGADMTVLMQGETAPYRYDQVSIEVEPGTRIAFTNDSSVTHTADCVDCPWSTGDVQPGETAYVTFSSDLRAQFRCRYHPAEMAGSIVVGNPPAAPSPEPEPVPTGG